MLQVPVLLLCHVHCELAQIRQNVSLAWQNAGLPIGCTLWKKDVVLLAN